MQKKLETLIINNADLSKIKSHVSRFNPIKVMGMEKMEIRHSNILGWLLNPRENHGLGDEFLNAFLCQAMVGEENNTLNALTINNRSLADANVFVEWNNIDIFIEVLDESSEKDHWYFVIENKVFSSQSEKQLEKYREYIAKRYTGYKQAFIFLSLLDETPEDSKYSHIRYNETADIINNLLIQMKDILSTRIYNFINYYLEIITELCDMNDDDKEMKSLARQIYYDNKKAFDFIFEHGKSSEFDYAVSQFIKEKESPIKVHDSFSIDGIEYKLSGRNQQWFSFIPSKWSTQLRKFELNGRTIEKSWPGCSKWRDSGLPIDVWLQLKESNTKNGTEYYIWLIVEVGPVSDYKVRKKLIESIDSEAKKSDNNKIKFQNNAFGESAKYSRCLSLKEKIDNPQDTAELEKSLKKIIDTFTKNHINVIETGIKSFVDC